ncbi:MAG: hypothetical protein Q8N17_21060 [Burkholderiaceae bacterium]|nr:hypothetical protein [Burkholderiaceae bacterium]
MVQHLFEEQRDSPLTLLGAAHQQRREGHQPRSGLTLRHAGGKFAAGARRAAGAGQPMLLVFGDELLDLGQVPDLIPPRLRIVPRQRFAATPAGLGFDRDHRLTLVGRNQRPLVPGMPRLTAPFLAALRFLRRGFGVRMLGAGRQGRIAGRFLERGDLGFERGDAPFVMVAHRLQQRPKLGRQGGNLFGSHRRWLLRHAEDVADFEACAKTKSQPTRRTGCERLRVKMLGKQNNCIDLIQPDLATLTEFCAENRTGDGIRKERCAAVCDQREKV